MCPIHVSVFFGLPVFARGPGGSTRPHVSLKKPSCDSHQFPSSLNSTLVSHFFRRSQLSWFDRQALSERCDSDRPNFLPKHYFFGIGFEGIPKPPRLVCHKCESAIPSALHLPPPLPSHPAFWFTDDVAVVEHIGARHAPSRMTIPVRVWVR